MVFSSHVFCFFFLPAALALYYAIPMSAKEGRGIGRRGRHLVLALLSYGFYAWANPSFVLLMLASTAIDFVCGLVIAAPARRQDGDYDRLPADTARSGRQRLALTVSIVSNLGVLGFFKYAGFFAVSWNELMGALGADPVSLMTDGSVTASLMRVALPLGISFYTFQSLSYSVDVYRGHAAALRNPIDFACFVSMFPQLVAGPILRFSEVAEQLEERTHTVEKAARGCAFFAFGMAKKVLLANPCGQVADTVFDAADRFSLDAWYGAVAYAFQIYFDFSGYSDMAIGLGLMLGFVFPKNFDSPYRSESITEFWRRWHLSLSRFLRDYLYIPLGGSQRGRGRTYVNLMIVMLLGGLWHGASWTFVIWGGLHGTLLAFERLLGGEHAWKRLHPILRRGLIFALVTVGWVFFRSASLVDARDFLASMIGIGEPAASAVVVNGLIYRPYDLLAMFAAANVVWLAPQTWNFTRRLDTPRIAWALSLFVFALVLMETQGYNPFIYFIF